MRATLNMKIFFYRKYNQQHLLTLQWPTVLLESVLQEFSSCVTPLSPEEMVMVTPMEEIFIASVLKASIVSELVSYNNKT